MTLVWDCSPLQIQVVDTTGQPVCVDTPASRATATGVNVVIDPSGSQPPQLSIVIYYDDCDEARAHDAAPLKVDDPGYRAALDTDGNGIVCDGNDD